MPSTISVLRVSLACATAVIVTRVVMAATRVAMAAEPLPMYQQVVGADVTHPVSAGETLGAIARRFGISTKLAVTINGLADANRLRLGQPLRLSNRHIVPEKGRDGIVVNVAERALYWLRDGAVMARFPVGVGRATWQTPPGHYTIVGRRRDPIWHVPRSIQREMEAKGEPVKKKVAPGPDNPLGKYWLQLSTPGYGIHGTNAPWTVGKYTTHGCVRLRPDDIEWLFNHVPTGTPVDIVDEPVKLARLDDHTILLEASQGIDDEAAVAARAIAERLQLSGVAELVDMNAVNRVLRDAWGVAVDVSKKAS